MERQAATNVSTSVSSEALVRLTRIPPRVLPGGSRLRRRYLDVQRAGSRWDRLAEEALEEVAAGSGQAPRRGSGQAR